MLKRVVLGSLGFIVFFVSWEVISRFHIINPVFLPPIEEVAVAFYNYFATGKIYPHLSFSLTNFAIGIAIAICLALPLGFIIGWNENCYFMFDPLISAIFAIPIIAILPIIILIFGIGSEGKIFLTFLAAFFPILINLIAGTRASEETLVEMARSFGANSFQIFRTVILPGSIPYLIAGLRIGLTRALIFIVVSEEYGSIMGLGYLIHYDSAFLRIAESLSVVVIFALIAIVLGEIVKRLEAHVRVWRV